MQTAKTSTQPATEVPPGKKYGYVRISMRHQKEDRQIAALLEQGIPRRNIFVDKQSGKDFDRDEYQTLLPSEKAFASSFDRLADLAHVQGWVESDQLQAAKEDYYNLIRLIGNRMILPEKVDVKETLERGRQVAEQDIWEGR